MTKTNVALQDLTPDLRDCYLAPVPRANKAAYEELARGVRRTVFARRGIRAHADDGRSLTPCLRGSAWRGGGYTAVLSYLQGVIAELRSVMLLVGARDIPSLRKSETVITGRLREWINSRS